MQVIDYYAKKSIVANLPAEKPPKEVTTEVQKVLSSWRQTNLTLTWTWVKHFILQDFAQMCILTYSYITNPAAIHFMLLYFIHWFYELSWWDESPK